MMDKNMHMKLTEESMTAEEQIKRQQANMNSLLNFFVELLEDSLWHVRDHHIKVNDEVHNFEIDVF